MRGAETARFWAVITPSQGLVDQIWPFESQKGFPSFRRVRVWRMRTGIFIALIPFHRRRLEATVRDRADGIGTVEIMRRTRASLRPASGAGRNVSCGRDRQTVA